ncbi:MAG: YitT family protein, partial [Paludibacteraceae bacterium]|nr:YitT family protein [Paludibacteraceae bacterium]
VNGVRQSVQFFIFSKEYAKIADAINKEVHRGVTIFDGVGWYSQKPIKVINVLARKNESAKIFKLVKDIDPNAFVSQSSAIGVYGQGFDVMKGK